MTSYTSDSLREEKSAKKTLEKLYELIKSTKLSEEEEKEAKKATKDFAKAITSDSDRRKSKNNEEVTQ